MRRPAAGGLRTAVVWIAALAAITIAMFFVRERLDKAHIALALLIVVLLGSAAGGRAVGLWLAGISFFVFDFLFLPPYYKLTLEDPLDWLVLIAFLATSVVAAQLLYRAQEEARVARARAGEVDRLATLGAESLSAGRADEALAAVGAVIREATRAEHCSVFARADDGHLFESGQHTRPDESAGAQLRDARLRSLLEWVATAGSAAYEQRDGTTRLGAERPGPDVVHLLESGEVTALLLPLRVRDRTVGVLRLAHAGGLRLDPERWRFVDALSYYAALAVERVRLTTEAERAEALREADRLKDAVLASVSHDLRTPLTTIKALAHDLTETGDERAEIIEQEADRLNRLVTDLLDLSTLKAGAFAVHLEVNAVDDLLGALVQQVEPSLGGRRLAVTLPAGEPIVTGRFDLPQSLRVLANLVVNASKYAPGHDPIGVHVTTEDGEIAIRVMDRGPGVPPEEVARIFDPFYRPRGAQPDVGSAGLGLSIAQSLARAQGGRLTYSPRVGGGSVFTLYLPVARLDEGALER